MIKDLKKTLKSNYRNLIYKLFFILYGKIIGKVSPDNEEDIEIKKISLEKNYSYKSYIIYNGRLYTDTIHDTAVILRNKIVERASFQLRNNVNVNCEENVIFNKGTPRLKKKLKGTVLSLLTGGGGNSNYWHWLFDVLPRLHMASNFINHNQIDYYLFPDLKEKFQKETLDSLNLPNKKRISSKSYRHFSANKIIITDHPYNLLNDPLKDSLNIPYWIISFLRKKFLNEQSEQNQFPKKIYIDRSDSKSRHGEWRTILNETEVKKTLKDKGYEFLVLSNYRFMDQVKIFNQAQSIVGLHGAGFANIVFCKHGTNVLELQSNTAGDIIKNISEKNNLKYDSISVKPKKATDNQLGHIEINIQTLKDKI